MKAIVLCAGKGTRMLGLTEEIPKPLIKVNEKPLLWYNIRLLSKHNVKEVAINLHYMPEKIKDYLKDGSDFKVNINYSYEKELLGTAGAIKKLNVFFENDSFIVMYGDNITNIDLSKVIEFHKQKGGIATIVLHKGDDPKVAGSIILDENNRVIKFIEKGDIENDKDLLFNSGIYVLEPKILDYIPEGKVWDFGHNVFPQVLEEGEKVYGYATEEFWYEVGTKDKYEEIHRILAETPIDF